MKTCNYILKRLLLGAAAVTFALAGYGQGVYGEIMADMDKARGIYRMYSFDTPSATPPPKGYKPFHISHYGRHGARYVIDNREYDNIAAVLSKAHEDGMLTGLGLDVHGRFMSIYPYLKGRAGDLSPKGQEQHRLLARRMYSVYPGIFSKSPRIEAYSTVVPRCIMSMAAFCEGLREKDCSLDIFTETSGVNMHYMNPHSANNPAGTKQDLEYKTVRAPWRSELNAYRNELIDTDAFLARLFTDTGYAAGICNPMEFETDLYFVAAHMQCTDFDISFRDVFTDDELFRFWEFDNYKFYIEKGPDPRNGGRMPALSETLLRNIVDCAGQAVADGGPSVRLRFGHDGCIMGLLALMQIDGWNTPVDDPAMIKEVWRSYRVPMASNIQLVFYRSKKDPDVLLRMLLNEEEIMLPLPGDLAPYYKWSDFKAFYDEILKQAVIKLEETR